MIEHEGIIEKINGNHITVRILQQSACSACHAKGACMAADMKEKRVDVSDSSGLYRPHERVVVTGKESIGYKAVLWASPDSTVNDAGTGHLRMALQRNRSSPGLYPDPGTLLFPPLSVAP